MNNTHIRPALKTDTKILTEISFKSKAYWNYPGEYFEIWKDELTISEKYVVENSVFTVEFNQSTIAYYSIVTLENPVSFSGIEIQKGPWLEHMFVLPNFIGQGIGSQMVTHLKGICNQRQIHQLRVLADPNSKVFYEKRGFQYLRELPSTIPKRTTPELLLSL